MFFKNLAFYKFWMYCWKPCFLQTFLRWAGPSCLSQTASPSAAQKASLIFKCCWLWNMKILLTSTSLFNKRHLYCWQCLWNWLISESFDSKFSVKKDIFAVEQFPRVLIDCFNRFASTVSSYIRHLLRLSLRNLTIPTKMMTMTRMMLMLKAPCVS